MHGRNLRPATNHKGQTFTQWMQDVDNQLSDKSGLTSTDLGDIKYRDLFEDDCDASEAVSEVLEQEGFPFED